MGKKDLLPEDGEQLSAYLDDALSTAERQRVEDLLAHSEAARASLEELKRVRRLFQGWEPVSANPFFLRRIECRLADEGAQTDSDQQWLRGLRWLAAAAVLFIAVGSVLLLNLQIGTEVEHLTLDSFLAQSLDQDVRNVATLKPADFSKDHVLDLVLTAQAW